MILMNGKRSMNSLYGGTGNSNHSDNISVNDSDIDRYSQATPQRNVPSPKIALWRGSGKNVRL